MAATTYDGIIANIIDNILITNPQIDVKIGEPIRDLFINIQAQQLEIIYSYLATATNAQSILTAMGPQLDRIGYNYNVVREPALRSSVTQTIEIQGGVSAPTVLSVGDQFSTLSDSSGNIQTFANTQLTLLTTGQTLATIPLVNLTPGSTGNVPAYSITQSNYSFVTSVYNAKAATGGTDKENDTSFAARIPTALTGQYINTQKGVLNTLLNVQNIIGTPYFATPDSPNSRGQYTVDVYLQRDAGYYGTPVLETAPANQAQYTPLQQPLYPLNPINQVTVYNPITNTTVLIPQMLNGVAQYTVIDNPSDIALYYKGTIQANQILQWLVSPPALPYQISYNVDNTILTAQTLFNNNNEITDDLLFKQANAIGIDISATLALRNGTNKTTAYTNANTNLTTVFDGLSTTEELTLKETEFTFFQDTTVQDLSITNFDTTLNVQLGVPQTSSQIYPNNQSSISPLGFFWENDVTTPYLYYKIASRLWIGNPDIIIASNFNQSSGFNFSIPTSNQGVINQDVINNVTTNWASQVLTWYDANNQVLILNFTTSAPVSGVVTFNFVQESIETLSSVSYLTLGPSVVSPVTQYQMPTTLSPTTTQQYATFVPNGLTLAQCILFLNGVPLTLGNSISLNDYQILSGPDPTTGLINIAVTNTPAATDILQFGILNPNLTFVNSTSTF